MEITQTIGFIGIGFAIMVPVPQIIKALRTKHTGDVSRWTYNCLLVAITCYPIRALAIKESVFIISNGIAIILNSWMRFLMWKYPK